VLKNTGNSPAINVQLHPDIVDIMGSRSKKQSYVDQMLEICKRAETTPDDNALEGNTIFPGDTFTYDKWPLAKKTSEIEYDVFAPEIIGCVSYRFSYERGRHVTQFIVDLRKYLGQRGFMMSDVFVRESDLVLIPSFIGGNAD